MVRVASFKVEKSKTYDVAQNVVRIDEKKRTELGVDIGDAVIIRSSISVITAIVKSAIKHDVGKNILKLDEKQRQMLGVDDGTPVDVINYLDYKMEEKKLKPEPIILKPNLPNQVVYTNHYEQTNVEKIVGGDDVGGHKLIDSLMQQKLSHGSSNKNIYCPECGSEIAKGQKFCVNCGKQLQPDTI